MALLAGKRNIQDDGFITTMLHARAALELSLGVKNQGKLSISSRRTGSLPRVVGGAGLDTPVADPAVNEGIPFPQQTQVGAG